MEVGSHSSTMADSLLRVTSLGGGMSRVVVAHPVGDFLRRY